MNIDSYMMYAQAIGGDAASFAKHMARKFSIAEKHAFDAATAIQDYILRFNGKREVRIYLGCQVQRIILTIYPGGRGFEYVTPSIRQPISEYLALKMSTSSPDWRLSSPFQPMNNVVNKCWKKQIDLFESHETKKRKTKAARKS